MLCRAVICLQESKLKHLALRSNLAVRKGDGKDIAYRWAAYPIAVLERQPKQAASCLSALYFCFYCCILPVYVLLMPSGAASCCTAQGTLSSRGLSCLCRCVYCVVSGTAVTMRYCTGRRVLPDLMGRTLQIVTHEKEELVCFVQKTAKALVMEVSSIRCNLQSFCKT